MRHILFTCLTLLLAFSATAEPSSEALPALDYDAFRTLPILHEGRVKPLDTVARVSLQSIYGKQRLQGQDAIAWLAELLFSPEKAFERPVFNIPNPDVIHGLNLEANPEHHYAYTALSLPLLKNLGTLRPLLTIPEKDLTLAQQQLVMLYSQMQLFGQLGASMTSTLPIFTLEAPLAEKLDLPADVPLPYMQLQKKRDTLLRLEQEVARKHAGDETPVLSNEELDILRNGLKLKQIESDSDNNFLRLIPPQWERQQEEWLSPWAVITSGEGSPETARLFDLWTELAAYYRKGDAYGWQQASQALLAETLKSAGQYADANLLRLEVLKNRLQPFTLSLAAYIAAFLLLLASFMGRRALLQRCAFWLLASGATIHALGIIARIMILQRPPVGTLYESVIWVGLIAALFGLILERRRHNGAGLLIGTLTGAILHMVGFRLGSDGDTMGMLIAVLNTNFWLTTHVLTITIGYGCCLVGGLLGHLYLLACIFRPAARTLQLELYRNMHGVTLVALLFTLIGTILGGIWADQSWGRFWGWDPKENGALLIVLWLIWLMHGRLGGILHELGYAIGMVFTNVTVALSWFGVNLLSVGLHSYGFIDSVAWGLGIFCTVETAFALITLALIRSRKGNANEG